MIQKDEKYQSKYAVYHEQVEDLTEPDKLKMTISTRRKENIEDWVNKELKEFEACDLKYTELKEKVESKSKSELLRAPFQ